MERTIRVELNVILGPKPPVRTSGPDLETAAPQRVKKERSSPTVDQLALTVEANMLIRDEPLTRRVLATQSLGPILIGAKWPICGGFDKEREVIHQA
jgi:hypothetical protein